MRTEVAFHDQWRPAGSRLIMHGHLPEPLEFLECDPGFWSRDVGELLGWFVHQGLVRGADWRYHGSGRFSFSLEEHAVLFRMVWG